jgi:hypothetical protein
LGIRRKPEQIDYGGLPFRFDPSVSLQGIPEHGIHRGVFLQCPEARSLENLVVYGDR